MQRKLDATIAILREGETATVAKNRLVDQGLTVDQAALCVRIAQARIMEAETVESATIRAVEMIDDGASIENITFALCTVEGMYVAAKAVARAKKRRGI